MTANLNVGDAAPDFTRLAAGGEQISLSQFRGRSAVVLYFYPRDNTSVCTAEACLFRDNYESFQSAGAEVIGVSPNSLESHRQFANQNRLPFHLLSDADGSLRALYGVAQILWVIPNRTTFVIDRQGIVRHVYSAMFQAARHVEEALRVLAELQAAGSQPNRHA
jgi:peroxiredoxin Q/BCP